MKDLTPKLDDTAGAQGQLTAVEFNDFANDVQNAIEGNGQTLTASTGDDNRQLAKAIAGGGDFRTISDTGTALIGETVIPDNSGGPITIKLPLTSATKPLYDGAVVLFTDLPPQPYSVNPVTFDAQANTVRGSATTVEVTTNDLLGGFKWDASNSWWTPIKRQVAGTQ